jgi:hypothetical protein
MRKLLIIIFLLILSGVSSTTQADMVLAEGKATAQWYNPERDGEGFFVEIFVVDGQELISIAMFTYDENGDQMWLTGFAELGSDQTFVSIDVNRFDGPMWGPDYNVDDLNLIPFGQINASFPNCDSGMFQVLTDVGLANGNYGVVRLTDIKGIECHDPEPPQQAYTPGRWKGPGVCFYVAPDGLSITQTGSTCEPAKAFDSNLNGLNNDLNDCGVEAECVGKWTINNGTFNCVSEAGTLAIGNFLSNDSASGVAIEGEGGYNDICTAVWTASPD